MEFFSPIKVPAATDNSEAVNRGQMNVAIAAVDGGGGGGLTSFLGGQMEPPKGYYPDADLTTNVLQATAPTAYTSQVARTTQESPARFRIGGVLAEMETFHWNNINGVPITGSTSETFGITAHEIEFWCSGADLTFVMRNEPGNTAYGGTDYLIMVDDMIVRPSSGSGNVAVIWNGWNHTPEATGTRYHVMHFASSRVRRIRIFLGLLSLVEVRIPGASDIWPAPPRFRIASTGDSWGHASFNGSEDDIMAGVFTNELAIASGWEVWNLHQGGTGYNNPGAVSGSTPFGSAGRLAALAALPALDAVMIVGGGNDVNRNRVTVLADANAMWTAIKTARPTTPLIVVGPQPANLLAGLDTFNTDMRASALASEYVDLYVDMYVPGQWITGTSGTLDNRDGNGSRDMFISNEALADLHPTHAGSRNVAQRLARALRGAVA